MSGLCEKDTKLFFDYLSNCEMQKILFTVLTEAEKMVAASLACDVTFHIVKL